MIDEEIKIDEVDEKIEVYEEIEMINVGNEKCFHIIPPSWICSPSLLLGMHAKLE